MMKRFKLWDIITVVFGLVILWQLLMQTSILGTSLNYLKGLGETLPIGSASTIYLVLAAALFGVYLFLQTKKTGSYRWLLWLAIALLIMNALGQERLARLAKVGDDTLESAVLLAERKGGTSGTKPAVAAPIKYAPPDRKVKGELAPFLLQPGQESITITNFAGTCLRRETVSGPMATAYSAFDDGVWQKGMLPGAINVKYINEGTAPANFYVARREAGTCGS